MDCSVERSWERVKRAQVLNEIRQALEGREEVRYVELFERLCDGSQCSAGTPDLPLMADANHLTALAARERVLPILRGEIDWLRGLTAWSARESRLLTHKVKSRTDSELP
jgi:hypothetical protein